MTQHIETSTTIHTANDAANTAANTAAAPSSTHDSRLTPHASPHHPSYDLRPTTYDSLPLPSDFDLTPAIDARLNALARAGRHDPAARNELHRHLVGKIARFLAPWRGRHLALGDNADLQQEAFLVFAALVADWPDDGSFVCYFLGFFPWRLRHAIEAHERRWPTARLVVIPDLILLDQTPATADPADPLLPFLPLPDDDRRLLALRLRGGHTVAEAAHLLGWSRRTTFRRWHALLTRLARPAPTHHPRP